MSTQTTALYPEDEAEQLRQARERRAAAPDTPLMPQSNPTPEQLRAESERRELAPLNGNRDFNLMR